MPPDGAGAHAPRVELRASGGPARTIARAADAARDAGDGRLAGTGPAGPWTCAIEPGATLAGLLERVGIEPGAPLLSVVGERRVGPSERAGTALADGDVVCLMPAIRAG